MVFFFFWFLLSMPEPESVGMFVAYFEYYAASWSPLCQSNWSFSALSCYVYVFVTDKAA